MSALMEQHESIEITIADKFKVVGIRENEGLTNFYRKAKKGNFS